MPGRIASPAFVVALLALACAKDPNYGPTTGTGGGSTAGTSGTAGGGAPPVDSGLPSSFKWSSTGPLLTAKQDATHPILSVKDPSVVYADGRWHLFATTADAGGNWSIVYVTFTDWSQADAAPIYYLDNTPPGLRGYHAAPQVFYFAPQSKWYLIFQSGQPQYSTNDDVGNPAAWTAPVNFFASDPPGYTAHVGANGFWLDFFCICDDTNCHLFFADDAGELFRSQTTVSDFPRGFGDATVAIQGVKETVFEGDMVYRIKGKDAYLAIVEAFGPTGNRFFRSFVSPTLDGVWSPLAADWTNPFAGKTNVTFADGVAWTTDISHGELIRAGNDQKMEIDPNNLQLLYQGADPTQTNTDYFKIPWKLGLLTQTM
jgi:endo-1,4-beta-xylanase